MKKFKDDEFVYLEDDRDKIRNKTMMFMSFVNELGAKTVVLEILYNAIDECRNPRSPGNRVDIIYKEAIDTIQISDNGRGIPTDVLELIFTTLNSGSNIDSGSKNDLQTDTLGRNGVGTLAINALGEDTVVTTYRGGTENVSKTLVFHEGQKVSEETKPCSADKHGLVVTYKPSKVLGKNTRIVWDMILKELENIQYLNKNRINITSEYHDKDGNITRIEHKRHSFEEILKLRNREDSLLIKPIMISFDRKDIEEEVFAKTYKRFIGADIAIVFTSNQTDPYIDSFCNSNNTIDNGDHLDGAMTGICRYFQNVTKAKLLARENLDIKWDDVRTGLSLAVSLRTNMEQVFTNQTKHKVTNAVINQTVKENIPSALDEYFAKHPDVLKDCINIIKTNARARREGDKARQSVVRESLNSWTSYKIKNYDPCVNRGNDYKELFIIEGNSAKGSLKMARDPQYQALFAIRGVSANVYKMTLDQIVGANGNKEFNDLIKILGCNVGMKFDMNRLQFDKIVIASDADVDGLFIRTLLCSFFFKLYPEIIEDGRLYIAEPPLYRIDDKKDPFVINREDYTKRYIVKVMRIYRIGTNINKRDLQWFNKSYLYELLTDTSNYVIDMTMMAEHYLVNDRLFEMILEEFTLYKSVTKDNVRDCIANLQISSLVKRIQTEFPEIYYDVNDKLFKGVIDGKYQSLELSERMIRKSLELIRLIRKYGAPHGEHLTIQKVDAVSTERMSLLQILKLLRKYQPNILHRFKGLGENSADDIKKTIMDPNTRSLIRLNIRDMENDIRIFQLLRGSSLEDGRARKEMMANYHINRDLLDV